MNKISLRLLKLAYRKRDISFLDAMHIIDDEPPVSHASETLRYLVGEDLLCKFTRQTSDSQMTQELYRITPKGRSMIESRRSLLFDNWFNRTLATAAIIISMIALLKQ